MSADVEEPSPQQQAVLGDIAGCPPVAPVQYEYLDHTADVQLHSWGTNLAEAFEQCAMAMFGYMTEIDTVTVAYTFDISATGHDLHTLLYSFLDEWLFNFCAEPYFIARNIKILEFDTVNFRIRARGWGETFNARVKHPQGTEVKAITYSNMQVHERAEPGAGQHAAEVFVIIDI